MSKQIRNAKTVQNKSRTNAVEHVSGNLYKVVSGTSGSVYSVRLSGQHGGSCTCNWAKYRPAHDQRSGCSHVIAAINFAAQAEGATSVSAWTDEAQAERQHRRTMNIGDGVLVTIRA